MRPAYLRISGAHQYSTDIFQYIVPPTETRQTELWKLCSDNFLCPEKAHITVRYISIYMNWIDINMIQYGFIVPFGEIYLAAVNKT